jgi:hypothetical protein
VRAYSGFAKLLEALRVHDTRIVEALAVPQAKFADAIARLPGCGSWTTTPSRGHP